MPKKVKGEPFGNFQHSFCYNLSEQLEGDSLVQFKSFRRKSHRAEKIEVKNTKINKGDR